MALTISLGVALFAVLVAITLLVVEPAPIPGLEPLSQRQDAETALYLAGLALVALALLLVPRVADSIARGPNGEGLSLLAALAVGTLAAAPVVARVLPGDGPGGALAVLAAWWAVIATALALARTRHVPALTRLAPHARLVWAGAGASVVALVLAFSPLESISLLPLAVGAAVAAAALALWIRRDGLHLLRPGARVGLAADLAVIVLVVLAIPDLVIFMSPAVGGSVEAVKASVIQFHQDFLLGPANQLLAGDALLVDNASQYGVGSIYALGGWFQLAPIGYGTLGFLDGALYAVLFAAGYCTLRLTGVTRLLAAAALTLAVVALIYNLLYPVGGLLQHGPFRFGLPMVVVVAAVVQARRSSPSRGPEVAQLLALGLSSIWAFEAFVYTAATFAAIACFNAWVDHSEGARLRWLARRAALALASCAGFHVLLAGATLLFAGELPDWGQYFAFLDALLVGELADLTYDFSAWAPGLMVGVAYGASAIALVLLVTRGAGLSVRERPALTALAGTTAYGIALFSYFVNRSADDILPYVSFPLLLAATIWLSLLLRGALIPSRPAQLGGFALALSLALIAFATAWSGAGERFPHSPLAHLAPGGDSLTGALDRLWDEPVIDPRAPQAETLIERFFPGQRRAPVIISSDLTVEALMQSERANDLPFGNPVQDWFASAPDVPTMTAAVDRLEAGDRVLMQASGLAVVRALEAGPGRDPIDDPVPVEPPDNLTPQQQWMLDRINERFELRPVHRDEDGFIVVELNTRRA